jgi:peptidyl-prolyl cis-trans isomerase SurA
MKKVLSILLLAAFTMSVTAQTLFTYGGREVSKDEFLRMYKKNIVNKQPDMSDSALRAYLQLYYKFKMKVAESQVQRLDTIPSIQNELNVYKKQLAKTYLTDKDVVNNMVKETYERLKQDIEVASITILVPRGVTGADTLTYYKKMDSIQKAIVAGADFNKMARVFSEDKATANKDGYTGYLTAMQYPYSFENNAYNTAIGKVSPPFKTEFGYHILKVISKRPAIGKIVCNQILLLARKSAGDEYRNQIAARADSLYKLLKTKPGMWDALVTKFNEDKFTQANGGEMKPFGIGELDLKIEQTATAFKKAGEISSPIETEYGYHILKFNKRIPVKSFDTIRNELTRSVERDGRVNVARSAFVSRVMEKNNVVEIPQGLAFFIRSIPDSLCQNNAVLMPTNYTEDGTLFTIKGAPYKFKDFVEHINKTSRGRIYGFKDAIITTTYKSYLEQSVLDYEENNLEYENTDFKNLIQEYKDGIMIFELTDKNVWSKASIDTVGLQKFYALNEKKYLWGPSFTGKQLRCTDEAVAKQFLEEIKTKSFEDALNTVNGTQGYKINVEEVRHEYAKQDKSVQKLKVNEYSQAIKNNDNTYTIFLVTKIHADSEQKSYKEARGYVIADYQDYLEKEWIATMEAKYPLIVKENVMKSLSK